MFFTLYAFLTFTNLFSQQMLKIPDFSGFREFHKVSKLVPNHVQKSQELGLFPESSNTELN